MTWTSSIERETWPWVDLRLVLDGLRALAEDRETQKRPYASTRSWAKDGETHLPGLVGEYVYGLACGQSPDYILRITGDTGEDFPGVDVKTATFIEDPDLKVNPEDLDKNTAHYALVAFDVANNRAAYLGWTSRDEVASAPLRNYGYGFRLAINWRELHRE